MDNQTRNHLNLQKHIADQDHIIRVRNAEIAALRKRAEKAEMESGRAAEVAERWRESYDALVSIRRTDPHRPLTTDDITDEMAMRFLNTYKATHGRVEPAIRAGVEAMFSEPTRPEGAYELETVIGCHAGKWTGGAKDVRDLADLLASKGVRVTDGGN